MNIFNMPLNDLDGIGPKRSQLFSKLNINSVYDLLYYFPYKYQDRSVFCDIADIGFLTECSVKCTLTSVPKTVYPKKNMSVTVCKFSDETGDLKVTWYNQPYLSKTLRKNEDYVLFGKFVRKGISVEISNPVIEKQENFNKFSGKIVPVYSLCKGLSQKTFDKAVLEALKIAKKLLLDNLPESIIKKFNLLELLTALSNVHFPSNFDILFRARQRFLFEEYFYFFVALSKIRSNEKPEKESFSLLETDEFEKNLPFKLTNAQKKVIAQIKNDIILNKPVKRLLQGDVGSGKTVVAAEFLYLACINNSQGLLMAPTEILAKQHYLTLTNMLPRFKIELLTSSVSKKDKQRILEQLNNGKIDVLVGTHAVIEDNVKFSNLEVIICDEQHRFGVNQRKKLIEKGNNPHFLVMTATPIPRTLSLILYGDLEVSVIDELPPDRKEIKTYLVNESYRKRVYAFLKKHLDDGEQAYVVCPLVDVSETMDLKDATNFSEYLQHLIPEYKIGLIHGKLKDSEKDYIMNQFKKAEINILVSTTVIEVGVDVPNSTIMIIENAERFGLSQLHQLRGRIGRGDKQSFCIMFGNTKNKDTLERLRVIQKSTDGFYISEQDLKLRGPGDFLGTRQSGVPQIAFNSGDDELRTLYNAKDAANMFLNNQFNLLDKEISYINNLVDKKFSSETKNILN